MNKTRQIPQIDLFKRQRENDVDTWDSGTLVGRPFRISYTSVDVWMPDAWKQRAGGVPQGAFLLAYYDSAEKEADYEAILLRVKEPIAIPQDQDIITGIIECYQENIQTNNSKESQIDFYTRYHSSTSGLRCSILGCFYKDKDKIAFGADLENFYSARNYSIIKPSETTLGFIVNYRENREKGISVETSIRIGRVRYSSSRRFQSVEQEVPVYIQATDFAGKRTALFGMTRTGKSNTLKKLIQAIATINDHTKLNFDQNTIAEDKTPKESIGQIIFDINGEYANSNHQDDTAIFDMFSDRTDRYSTVKKEGFKMMKVNFYKEIEAGFNLLKSYPRIADYEAQYLDNFLNVSLEQPSSDENYYSEINRYHRKIAVYLCCLFRAKFPAPNGFKIRFRASKEVCDAVNLDIKHYGDDLELSLDEACQWWEKLWSIYDTAEVFKNYFAKNKRKWADDDLEALLIMLTRKSRPGVNSKIHGYLVLKGIIDQHTEADQDPFDEDILKQLRKGRIVIVDLSLGDPYVQKMFSERITQKIFDDALKRFTKTEPNNYIQFYFEEAHNLFPKKEDKDLSQIYNRLAKEGAKLNLGLTYATQEVSSISGNILKATQNWFISHLNNQEEIRELTKYYDFGDFTESLIRFSQNTDKGFARIKTYSNAFVVPTQIDEFEPTTKIKIKQQQAKKSIDTPSNGLINKIITHLYQ